MAAAHAQVRAGQLGRPSGWHLPLGVGVPREEATAAVVEGTLLRAWEYAAARKEPATAEATLGALTVVGGDRDAARAAQVVAEAANWSRTQQHEPPNVLTPTELGERALALSASALTFR